MCDRALGNPALKNHEHIAKLDPNVAFWRNVFADQLTMTLCE